MIGQMSKIPNHGYPKPTGKSWLPRMLFEQRPCLYGKPFFSREMIEEQTMSLTPRFTEAGGVGRSGCQANLQRSPHEGSRSCDGTWWSRGLRFVVAKTRVRFCAHH